MRYLISISIIFMFCTALVAAQAVPKYHVERQLALPGNDGWDYLTFDAASGRLFISRASHVMVVEAAAGKVVGDIPDTEGVHGIALAPSLHKGFTSNGRGNSVSMFDLQTLRVLSKIPVGENPDAIVYEPRSQRVFTFNGRSHDATALDARSGEKLGTIPLEGKPEFAVVGSDGRIFVNLEDKSQIAVVDSRSLKVLQRWPIAPGEEPSGLALDAVHHLLYASCDNEKMVTVDTSSGKVVATAAIGKGTDAALYDAGKDLAFSSNGVDGTLSVVRRGKTLATVPTVAGARTMALDPRSHRIYLVTAKEKGREGRRRIFEPGTFTLLVVSP